MFRRFLLNNQATARIMANTDEYYFTVLRLVKEAGSVSGHLSQESSGVAGTQLVRCVSSYSWLIVGLRLSILHASDCKQAPTSQQRFLFRAGLRSASSAMYYPLQRECGIHSSSAMNFKFLDRVNVTSIQTKNRSMGMD